MGRKLLRWARGELIWCAVAFVLIQLGLAYCVETKLPRVRDVEFAVKLELLQERIAEQPHQPLALVLGSSRTQMGLDAGLLSQASDSTGLTFNMGFEGSGPMMHRVNLRRLRDAGIRPDLVVVEVVPAQLLARNGSSLEDRWLNGARLRADELALVYPYSSEHWRLVSRWLLGRILPTIHHQKELHRYLPVDQALNGTPTESWMGNVDGYGWKPYLGGLSAEQTERAGDRALGEFRDDLTTGHIAPAKVQGLHDLFDECRNAGIPAALLLMPEGSRFRALCSESLNRELAEVLDRLREECGLKAVIDARTWVQDDDFLDTHHLLMSGSRVFTERFDREVLHPLLTQSLAGPCAK